MSTFAKRIRPSVQSELDASSSEEARGNFHTAFSHLERAHVLGQFATWEHVRVHWLMFAFAVRNRLAGEAVGQIWRLLAAIIFTPSGLVPEGNTGGSKLSGMRKLAIPHDLQQLIDGARA